MPPSVPPNDFLREHPEFLAAADAPAAITIASRDEAGERMVVSGMVTDGTKPLAGISMYIYHADARGCYPSDCGDHGPHTFSARLHGALRTDAHGHYRYETIRPAGYNGGPAHVHYIVATTNDGDTWNFEMTFKDDPVAAGWLKSGTLILPKGYAPGAMSVQSATKDAKGVWQVTEDVVLKVK